MKSKAFKSVKIAVVYRLATPAAVSLAKNVAKWLKTQGHQVYTAPGQKIIPGTKTTSTRILKSLRLVVALGGDGTYLRAVRILNGHKVPILGVNLGSLGFLTPIRSEDVYEAIENTLANKMTLSPRFMLEIELRKNGKKVLTSLALNDIVLERGSITHLISIGINVNNNLINEVKANGIIVATPTGSTAYNLAAGGPILHPDSSVMVVTPIAPHALTSRPLIMPDQGKLTLKLAGKMQKAHLVVDGQKMSDVVYGDEVIIHRHKSAHIMVCQPDQNYFHLLREKLNFGDRHNATRA